MFNEIVRIYKSYVEPRDKHLLWMRPCLPPNKGYDLLYWVEGDGWTVWIKGCNGRPSVKPDDNNSNTESDRFDNICEEVPDNSGHKYEITTPCGCKD